jgi:hypothetical protein
MANPRQSSPDLTKGSPSFNRFYIKKTTQRLTITWGSPCLALFKNAYKAKKKPTSTSMNWGVQHSYFPSS